MLVPEKEKIALFVCNDLIGLLLLNRIVPRIQEIGYEPVIFNTGTNRNRKFKIPTPEAVSFFNSTLLTKAVIPALERNPTTHAPNHTFRQVAALYGVQYQEIENVNDPDFVYGIAGDHQYRGGIAMRFLQVFDKEAINVFHEKGFLWNLHSGLLPDYKGLTTPFRAIANGEKAYGMTLHDLTCAIDEGDIILKGELPLSPLKPVLDLYLDTVPIGVEMVLKSLQSYKRNGFVVALPQQKPTTQTYYPNLTDREFREFMSKGVIYADPQKASEQITKLFSIAGTALQFDLLHALEKEMNEVSPKKWGFCQHNEPLSDLRLVVK